MSEDGGHGTSGDATHHPKCLCPPYGSFLFMDRATNCRVGKDATRIARRDVPAGCRHGATIIGTEHPSQTCLGNVIIGLKILLSFFQKLCFTPRIPPHSDGALRAIVTTRGAGSDGCEMPQRGETRADERQLADVKACGPGAPTLALSSRVMMIPLTTVANKPGHRGERAVSVKTIAQGRPGVPGCTCGTCRLHFFRRRAAGVSRRLAFPAPSSREGETIGKTRTHPRRENASARSYPTNLIRM